MFSYFTRHMASLKKDRVYSRPVIQCMEYIDLHLHMPIRLAELAEHVQLNPSYLSVLFKKETGVPVSEYVLNRRIDTAKNMLLYSEYSASQISEILTFSSQSHFIRVFKKKESMTPREYKVLHDRDSLRAAEYLCQ
jgi:YesN/AraC family two-component response regulator